jgi:hypothetical protein
VVVRAQVVTQTAQAQPMAEVPTVTRVRVLKRYRGQAPQALVVFGADDHAPQYKVGDEVVLMLAAPVRARGRGLQRRGEEIYVAAGDAPDVDAYFESLFGRKEDHRKVVMALLRTRARDLQKLVVRAAVVALSGPPHQDEIRSAIEAIAERRLPPPYRLALYRAVEERLDMAMLRNLVGSLPRDEDGETIRAAVLSTLGRERRARGQAIAILREALAGSSGPVRVAAASGLASQGERDNGVLDALTHALGDANEMTRRQAIVGLAALARRHEARARALLERAAKRDPNPQLRLTAENELQRLPKTEQTTPVVVIAIAGAATALLAALLWLRARRGRAAS